MPIKKSALKLSFASIISLSSTTLLAQDSASTDSSWQVNWTPYLWAANIQADVKLGPASISPDQDFNDLVDKLDMAFMHYLEAHNGEWGIANEIIHLQLSDTQDGPVPASEIDVALKQTVFDLAATYRIDSSGHTIFTFGARHIALDLANDISGLGPLNGTSIDYDESWTNVLFGINQQYPIHDQWLLVGKFDVATDFSDELSYIITLGANYQMTDLLDLKFGYRYAGIHYEDDTFSIDETVDGLFTGLTFKF